MGSLLLVARREDTAHLLIDPPCQAMRDELWTVQMESLDEAGVIVIHSPSRHGRFQGRECVMGYKGYVQGDIVILVEPLPVPNGTEVEISIPQIKGRRNRGRKKPSVVNETFGRIPADAMTVRAVLEEERYET